MDGNVSKRYRRDVGAMKNYNPSDDSDVRLTEWQNEKEQEDV